LGEVGGGTEGGDKSLNVNRGKSMRKRARRKNSTTEKEPSTTKMQRAQCPRFRRKKNTQGRTKTADTAANRGKDETTKGNVAKDGPRASWERGRPGLLLGGTPVLDRGKGAKRDEEKGKGERKI